MSPSPPGRVDVKYSISCSGESHGADVQYGRGALTTAGSMTACFQGLLVVSRVETHRSPPPGLPSGACHLREKSSERPSDEMHGNISKELDVFTADPNQVDGPHAAVRLDRVVTKRSASFE